MGLIEIVLAALSLNSTIFSNFDSFDYYDSASSSTDLIVREEEEISNHHLRFMHQLMNDLKNEHLIVTTLDNEKLSGSKFNDNRRYGTGIAFELLNILQEKFHFNYTIIVPKNNTWGSSEDGVLTLLKNKEANLSAAFLPVLREYNDYVSYSPSLDTGQWFVLMKRPKESATGEGLLAPFTLPVWLLILLSLLIVGPIIYFIIYLQSKLINNNNNNDTETVADDNNDKMIFSLSSCIWFVYGALLKQGSTLNPISDSSRLLFATWWIFITILTAFYTANLTAFLTLSKFTLPITKADDIGNKRLPWVTTKGNALEDTKHLNNQTLGQPKDYLNFTDNYILDEYVNKKNMMFIREQPIIQYTMYDDYKKKTKDGVVEEKRCTYVITKFDVLNLPRAFAYSKNFKYKLLFDKTIQYLVEAGIIKYKLHKQLPDTEICPLDLGSKERRLRNSDLIMTYMIVGGGFTLAIIIFLIELLLMRKVIRRPKLNKFTNNNNINNNNNNNKMHDNNVKSKHQNLFETNLCYYKNDAPPPLLLPPRPPPPPPPPYYTLFSPTVYNKNIRKKTVNGRDYWIYENDAQNEKRMIPVRTPSALLFQFTN